MNTSRTPAHDEDNEARSESTAHEPAEPRTTTKVVDGEETHTSAREGEAHPVRGN